MLLDELVHKLFKFLKSRMRIDFRCSQTTMTQ